jgi:hypothetical protein
MEQFVIHTKWLANKAGIPVNVIITEAESIIRDGRIALIESLVTDNLSAGEVESLGAKAASYMVLEDLVKTLADEIKEGAG